MPQITQLQSSSRNRNIQEGEVASRGLSESLADMRRRQKIQNMQLGALRQDMAINAEKYGKDSSVTVSAFNEVVGNDSYYKAFNREEDRVDLSIFEDAKAPQVSTVQDNISQLDKKIQDQNNLALGVTAPARGATESVSASIMTSDNQIETGKRLAEWQQGKQSKDFDKLAQDAAKVSGITTDAIKKLMIAEEKDPKSLSEKDKKSLDKFREHINSKQSSSLGVSQKAKLGLKESVSAKFKTASGEAKNTELMTQDKGLKLTDEIKRTTSNLSRNAMLADVMSGYDSIAMQSNRYSALANKREEFIAKKAALEQSRYTAELKQGEMKINAAEADFDAMRGYDTKSDTIITNNISSGVGPSMKEKLERRQLGRFGDVTIGFDMQSLGGGLIKIVEGAVVPQETALKMVDEFVPNNKKADAVKKLGAIGDGKSFRVPTYSNGYLEFQNRNGVISLVGGNAPAELTADPDNTYGAQSTQSGQKPKGSNN